MSGAASSPLFEKEENFAAEKSLGEYERIIHPPDHLTAPLHGSVAVC